MVPINSLCAESAGNFGKFLSKCPQEGQKYSALENLIEGLFQNFALNPFCQA